MKACTLKMTIVDLNVCLKYETAKKKRILRNLKSSNVYQKLFGPSWNNKDKAN